MTGILTRPQLEAEQASLKQRLRIAGIAVWSEEAIAAYKQGEQMKTAGLLYRIFGWGAGPFIVFAAVLIGLMWYACMAHYAAGNLLVYITALWLSAMIILLLSLPHIRGPELWLDSDVFNGGYNHHPTSTRRAIPPAGLALMAKVRSEWPHAKFAVFYLCEDPILAVLDDSAAPWTRIHIAIFVWDADGNEVLPPVD